MNKEEEEKKEENNDDDDEQIVYTKSQSQSQCQLVSKCPMVLF